MLTIAGMFFMFEVAGLTCGVAGLNFTSGFKTMNYGTLLAYVTIAVQSDLILPELQQMYQWVIDTHSMVLFAHFEHLL